jgi:hypothetical protein
MGAIHPFFAISSENLGNEIPGNPSAHPPREAPAFIPRNYSISVRNVLPNSIDFPQTPELEFAYHFL